MISNGFEFGRGKGCEWYMVGDDGLVGEKRKTLPRPGKIDT